MSFSFFFGGLYNIPEVEWAFKIICADKILTDGYIDMSIYIKKRIKKGEIYAKLAAHKSKYAVLYNGTFPKRDNALSEWEIRMKKQNNDNKNDDLTYEEASAIVNWVFYILKNEQERKEFTKELFQYIKDLFDIRHNIRFLKGVAYNAAKVEPYFFSSVSSISTFISSLTKDDNRSIFYRGHANANYILRPSIMRTSGLQENESTLYHELLINCPEEFEKCNSHLEKLVKMQHYGLPTRLLDITRNLLVALFFACESQPEAYGELVLIAANHQEIKYPQSDTVSILASLPVFSTQKQQEYWTLAYEAKNQCEFNSGAARLIHEVRLEKPAFQPEINKEDILNSFIVYALKNNNRIVKQDGAFILCGLDNRPDFLEKFRYRQNGKKVVLLINDKKKILEQLEAFSINRAALFPEIECVSEYLKNKYI